MTITKTGHLLALLLALLLAACGGDPAAQTPGIAPDAGPGSDGAGAGTDAIPPQPEFSRDKSEFVASEPAGNDGRYFGGRGPLVDFADSASEANTRDDAPAAPSGRTEAVEEADIYRVDGDKLYYFNTYRGLLIYDIADPKQPRLVSRVPVFGYPVEMFVSKGQALVLLRDVLELKPRETGKFYFERQNFSQIVSIDISKPERPTVGVRARLDGLLREGVSRKVGDTIYVVSHLPRSYYSGWSFRAQQEQREEAVYVYSFDVSAGLQQVDKLEVFNGGSYWERANDGSYASRYFNGVAISATSNALMVVENWRQNSSSRDSCSSSWRSEQEAVVSLIDISDPSGAIRRHAHFTTRGQLTDQFKQTYFYDDKSKQATYLGIFARNEWTGTACRSTRVVRNTLESWNVTSGDRPVRQDSLVFGKPDETVRGSAFDLSRKVAYAITAQAVDPLYALSFADPKALEIRSEIDGLSGDMNVFRLVGGNKYLIGIGRDTSDACSGTADTVRRPTQVAVSLIDVKSLDAIRLVKRSCVAVDNANWVNSQVNWNLDQAHKMIGMHSDGRVNVITVPISYSKKVDRHADGWWWYRHETAVGVMSWAVGDKETLTNHATVVHPNGQVKRSIVFAHGKATPRRMMINLSDTHLSLVDLEDLDKPTDLAQVEIAPYYAQVFRFGDYLVEQLGRNNGYYSAQPSKTEFRIKRLQTGQAVHRAEVVASFAEGRVQSVTKVGSMLVLFRQATTDNGNPDWQTSDALIYDLRNPAKPRRAGTAQVPASYPRYGFWCGDLGYWGGYWFGGWNATVALSNALVFRQDEYVQDPEQKTSTRRTSLVTLDLRNPDAPRVKRQQLEPAEGETYVELVPDGTDPDAFYLSSRQQSAIAVADPGPETEPEGKPDANGADFAPPQPEPKRYSVRYYAQRYRLDDANTPVGAARVNVRGRLVRAFHHPSRLKLLLTREDNYDHYYYTDGKQTAALHLHVEAEDASGETKAYWQSSVVFDDVYLSDLAIAGNLLVVNGNRANYYYRYDEPERVQQDWSNRLYLFDINKLAFDRTFGEPVGTFNMQLMGSHRGLLFFNLSGDGIMMASTEAGRPVFRNFVRTLGWATHIEFFGQRAVVAAGHYGISEISLN